MTNPHPADRPPTYFWILPGVICLLRILPWLWTLWIEPPEGMAVLHVGYNPRDFLAYLSFIRQLSEDGVWVWHDAFTTDPQVPRFILLFHWVLGVIAAVTNAAPSVVLELSRIPLTFLFFWVLWWFLRPVLGNAADRLWACAMVGLSGGIEGFLRPFVAQLPAALNPARIDQSTWAPFGWNTFASLYNPLWIAGLTLTLVILRPVLDPAGPRNRRDLLLIGIGFLLLYWVHPYSAIAVLAVVVARPIFEWVFEGAVRWTKLWRTASVLLPSLLLALIVGRWQAQDAVYRAASGNIFGTLQLPVFWYPLTLGAVGVVALRGAQRWIRQSHPYGVALLAWIGAIIVLHTSPIINGYHFLFQLHLPLCILGAAVVREVAGRLRDTRPAPRLAAAGLLFLVFASFVFVTVDSVRDIRLRNFVPASYPRVIEILATRPPGNALVPPTLGTMLPAFTPHRVWVGHWFLTPDYSRRVNRYEALTTDPELFDQLTQLLRDQQIRYLVIPAERSDAVLEALGDRVDEHLRLGTMDLLVLR